jgi:hypothetical protein
MYTYIQEKAAPEGVGIRVLIRRHLRPIKKWISSLGRASSRIEVFPDDTFIVSYPRSGSTWIRRLLVSIIRPDIEPSLKNIEEFIPDIHAYTNEELLHCKRPRVLKSHHSYTPYYPRVVYLLRDGRDVAVSYYDFFKVTHHYEGTFSEFVELMLEGDSLGFGCWQNHVSSWVAGAGNIPFLVIKYEQLENQGVETLREVVDFLDIEADESLLKHAYRKCDFAYVQRDVRENSRYYHKGYRGGVKGSSGAWKVTFSEKDLEYFWEKASEVMELAGYAR